MTKIFSATINYKHHFELTLNKEIVDLLIDRAKNHYDRTCQKSCEQGGFLYGWKNCIEFKVTCGASFRQLDLTLKILKNYCGTLTGSRISLEYTTFVKELLEKANKKTVLAPLSPTENMINSEGIKKLISDLEIIASELDKGNLVYLSGAITIEFPVNRDVLELTTLDSPIKPPKIDRIIFSSNAEFKVTKG